MTVLTDAEQEKIAYHVEESRPLIEKIAELRSKLSLAEKRLEIAMKALQHYDNMYSRSFVTHYKKGAGTAQDPFFGLKAESGIIDTWDIGDAARKALIEIEKAEGAA